MEADYVHKTIEEKLALYRAQKRKDERVNTYTNLLTHYVNVIVNFVTIPFRYTLPEHVGDTGNAEASGHSKDKPQRLSIRRREKQIKDINGLNDLQTETTSRSYTYIDWIIFLLKCLLWGVLWKIFILIEFGAVFFVLSGFVFIWLNLRSDSHKQGISAYSVFNPNCEEILGTFSAEKFEKELLHR